MGAAVERTGGGGLYVRSSELVPSEVHINHALANPNTVEPMA